MVTSLASDPSGRLQASAGTDSTARAGTSPGDVPSPSWPTGILGSINAPANLTVGLRLVTGGADRDVELRSFF